jgi:putative transposase
MDIVPGAHVNYAGEQYVITHILTVESVLAKHIESGRSQSLNVAELEVCRPEPREQLEQYETPDSISGQRWQAAEKSYELTREMGEEVAKTAGPGRFRGADFPLAIVQIDHTPMDVILVDDVDSQPIGRA